MEAARATWTDSRLDDLNGRVKEVADRVTDMDKKMDAGLGRLDNRIDILHQDLVHGMVALISIIAVLLTAFLTIVVTHL
jgi:hypothetical protein